MSTTSSSNFTTLYSPTGTVVPTAGYGNANVVSLLAVGTDGANTVGAITATGNITGNYFIGNGSLLTGISGGSGNYSNANVAAFLPTFGGNVNAVTVFGQGIATQGYDYVQMQYSNAVALPVNQYNIGTGSWFYLDPDGGTFQSNTTGTIRSVVLGNDGSVSAQGNIIGTRLSVSGTISATGNIVSAGNVRGTYILGDGSQLTNLPTGNYSNSNVVSLLASFGSNIISTTGNITGNTFVGNGAGLTNIAGANVQGPVANATYATQAASSGVANTAQQVSGNAQANITSLGTLTSLAVTGTVQGGNLATVGTVSATGNITGAYFVGNGSLLTGITTTYGNANVATFLAAFGSNTISTTGTITSGNVQGGNLITAGVITATGNIAGNYFIGNGSLLTGISGSGSYSNANATSLLANFGSNTIVTTGNVSFGNITATGMITTGASGNVSNVNYLLANVVSATGNITGNYFVGNGSLLTGISGGGGTPGGANTQIQYNNANAFAGNANFTFNNATGNINLGNVIFSSGNATNYINTVTQSTGTPANITTLSNSQITIGPGYNGNTSLINQAFAAARGAKFQVWDSVSIADSGGPRYVGISSTPYISLTGNVSNNNSTLRGLVSSNYLGGGSGNYTYNVSGAFGFIGLSGAAQVGQPNTVIAIGNTTVGNATGLSCSVVVNSGSTANNAILTYSNSQFTGNVGNVAGLALGILGTPGATPGNVFGIYMNGNAAATGLLSGVVNSNKMRSATNYYFLYNADTLAQVSLGSLRLFNEFRYDGANTSGTLAVDKNNGQVQNVYLTGAITSVTFANFVTSASDGIATTKYQTDTVTLILHQGSTPYAVTMPTGSAYKYAAGTTSVGVTANAVTMISVTATYDSITAADQYLITISPEFT